MGCLRDGDVVSEAVMDSSITVGVRAVLELLSMKKLCFGLRMSMPKSAGNDEREPP